ncbi:outer dense fiber protein 3-like protein 2 [Drosophila rhopaloa]|uniref:Outer dense fiber protein 3-like protein 2 n=1 Tax=Drosophila rhopaloa TaxID=1041015 RepID=A0A6P4EMX8_DRORH|nr:outer dense fiber protein 3-like protein 2 [Drosophila rhopaloa]
MSCNKSYGPGPGAYNLPSTFGYNNCDKRVQRSPQFSFGTSARSCNNASKVEGPGPAAYNLGKVTRFGRPSAEADPVFRGHSRR